MGGLGDVSYPLHQALGCYLRISLGALNDDHSCRFVRCAAEKE